MIVKCDSRRRWLRGSRCDHTPAQKQAPPFPPCCAMLPFFEQRRDQMSLTRTILIASIFLGPSVAVAQQPALPLLSKSKLAACTQSMIAGTWQAVFNSFVPNTVFACPITISTNGTVTPGTCTFGPPELPYVLVQPPSGTLTIDRACHVTGSISYSFSSSSLPNNISAALVPSLWRSADGSRLTGTQSVTGTCGPTCTFPNFYTFELVESN
jgi:hypothetical protein